MSPSNASMRDRAAIRRAQQTIGDLQRAFPAVSAIAALGQRTAAPFQGGSTNGVQHQSAAAEMTPGQSGLEMAGWRSSSQSSAA